MNDRSESSLSATSAVWRYRVNAQAVIGVGVDDVLIPNSVSILINPAHRLLKQPRFRITLGDRALHDVKLVFVHADVCEGARLIGIVCQLYEMTFNHVLPFPGKTGYLRVTLEKPECRVDNRSALILLPIRRTDHRRGICATLRVARRTRLRSLHGLLFDTGVIHNSQRIMLRAFVGAVYAGRQDIVQLRLPGSLRHPRLNQKNDSKNVLRVDVLHPFLCRCGLRPQNDQRENECGRAHHLSLPWERVYTESFRLHYGCVKIPEENWTNPASQIRNPKT